MCIKPVSRFGLVLCGLLSQIVGCEDWDAEPSVSPASTDVSATETNAASQPSGEILETTAIELERKIDSLPVGTRVRVMGVIESFPYVYHNVVDLFGYDSGITCQFENADDLHGLTEEQTTVVEGIVIRGTRRPGYAECKLLGDCKLISKGEIPGYAPAPYKLYARSLGNLTLPNGVEIDQNERFLTFRAEAVPGDGTLPIASDGTLPKEIIDEVARRIEIDTVAIWGKISTEGLKQVAELQGMKGLQLFDPESIEQLDFGVLAEHPRLRELVLRGGDRLSSLHLKQLGRLRCLASISVIRVAPKSFEGLDFSEVDDAGLAGLTPLKSLRWLRLDPMREGGPTKVTDEGIATLAALPRLRSLNLWSKSIDGSGLSALAACPEFDTLELSRCSVTSEGLKSLASLPKLAVLDLSETNADSSIASTIKELPLLRHLNLTSTNIDDEFFKEWGPPAELTHLILGKQTPVTAMGIKLLAENPPPRLRFLSLEYNEELTSEIVDDIKKIKTLETFVCPRHFDAAAQDELKKTNPEMDVY